MTPRGADPSTEIVQQLCEGSRYRPVRFLGRGGMGVVWVVQQRLLRREFAMKILHARFGAKPATMDRLRFEAQATARVEHPGIVQVIDFWVDNSGRACFVMELLEGASLSAALIQRRRLPTLEVLEIACQTLSALGAAHANGIIHRDIKPENIFLHELPGQPRMVKLLDFGLARILSHAEMPSLAPPMQRTRTGTKVGTLRYLSPEAARGLRVDARSDLYSVGLTLYEALTGRGPFDDYSENHVIVPPSVLAQGIPPELDACILRAIEADPADRVQTATAFESALRALLPGWHRGRRQAQ